MFLYFFKPKTHLLIHSKRPLGSRLRRYDTSFVCRIIIKTNVINNNQCFQMMRSNIIYQFHTTSSGKVCIGLYLQHKFNGSIIEWDVVTSINM